MTEQKAKALANELAYNRYWWVFAVREQPTHSGRWCILIVRKDLRDSLTLFHGDKDDLNRIREHTIPLAS